MRVTVGGYKQDSDTDFNLIPETIAERALLRAMRGRKTQIIQEETSNLNEVVMKFRTIVVGTRT